MRWLIGTVAVVAGLVVLVLGVGMLLPASHIAESHATIDAPLDSVWHALTDVDAFPSWRSDVSRIELLEPTAEGRRRWREIGEHGTIAYEEVASEPRRTIVTRIADPSLPFGGNWTYTLAPEGAGTRVSIREDGVVRNPFFRFMSRFVFGHHATQEAFLRSLGRRFGREVTPQRG